MYFWCCVVWIKFKKYPNGLDWSDFEYVCVLYLMWQSKKINFLMYRLLLFSFSFLPFYVLDFLLYFSPALFVSLQYVKAICVMSHCSSPVEVRLFPVKEISGHIRTFTSGTLAVSWHTLLWECVWLCDCLWEGEQYRVLTDGFCVGDKYVWLHWDVVTSNDVKELKIRLSPVYLIVCFCVFES